MKKWGVFIVAAVLSVLSPMSAWARYYPVGVADLGVNVSDSIPKEYDTAIVELFKGLAEYGTVEEDAVGSIIKVTRAIPLSSGYIEYIVASPKDAAVITITPEGKWNPAASWLAESVAKQSEWLLTDSATNWAQHFRPNGAVQVLEYDQEKQQAVVRFEDGEERTFKVVEGSRQDVNILNLRNWFVYNAACDEDWKEMIVNKVAMMLFAEDLTLGAVTINSFSQDGEVGTVQAETDTHIITCSVKDDAIVSWSCVSKNGSDTVRLIGRR